MKILKSTLFLSALFAFAVLFFSFDANRTSHLIDLLDDVPRSGGVGAILGQDRTGSPVSLGTCGSCHSGGSGTTTVAISMKNSLGAAVTQYTPGNSYTLDLNVSGTSGNRRAVQGVVLTSSNSQAGTLSGATGFSSLSTVSGRQYLEHTAPATSTTNRTFSATWTAPSAGTGTVTVYAAGLAANNDGGTSGDVASASFSLAISELVSQTNVFSTDSVIACDTYTWANNGVTYTSSNNTDKDTINLAGYDSIISLHLTLNNSTIGIDTQTACGSYTWINGVTYTANNTTAKDTLTNTANCDSIVTLNLTINNLDTSLVVTSNSATSNQTGASYQWLDCNNSFSAISGETNATFAAATSGSYAVEITNGSCVDTSRCVTFNFTSIGKNEIETFNVSPNPFNEILFIEGANLATSKIQLFDLSGKEYSTHIEVKNNSIKTSKLPKGMYILSINGKTKKLIKL